jgi:methanogenic corrinoid protein MtbC1
MLDLYLAEMPVLDICDRVIAGAFHRVGEHWECGEIEVYRERRACNLGLYAINDLRSFLPQPPASAPVAIGGAIEGDHYSLPTAMVEVVLRSLGWNATSLGSNLPLATLAAACREVQPRLLWLSASHVVDSARLVADYQSFLASVPADLPVVVGGQGLTHDLRKQLSYSAFCDTMRHLESFAGTLGR